MPQENHCPRSSCAVTVSLSALIGTLSAPMVPPVAGGTSPLEVAPPRHERTVIPPSCSFDLDSGRVVGESPSVQSIPDSPFPPFDLSELHSGAAAKDADLVWHCFSHEFEQDGVQISYEVRGIELSHGSRWALPIADAPPRNRDEALRLRFTEGEIPFDVGGSPQFGGRQFTAEEVSGLSYADRLQMDLYPLSLVPGHGMVIIQTAEGAVYCATLSVLPQHDQSKLGVAEVNKPGYYLVINSRRLD